MNILVKSKRHRVFIGMLPAPLMFLFVVFFGNYCVIEAQTVGELIAQGDNYHKQFDTYNAFRSYKAASELDSTNFDVLWKMAGELIDMGNELPKSEDQSNKYHDAEIIARKAIQLNPNHSKGHVMLALAIEKTALTETGQARIKALNQSRLAAEKALEINPNESVGYAILGRWNLEMANTAWLTKTFSKLFVVSIPPASYEKAAEQFSKAINISPACLSYYLEIGKTYVLLEKWSEAGEAFQKIVDLPTLQKSDSKWQREAKHYLLLLQQGNHSELVDSIKE